MQAEDLVKCLFLVDAKAWVADVSSCHTPFTRQDLGTAALVQQQAA